MKKVFGNKHIGRVILSLCFVLIFGFICCGTVLAQQINEMAFADGQTDESADDLNITLDYCGGKKNDGEKEISNEILNRKVTQVSLPTKANSVFYGYYTLPNRYGQKIFDAYGKKVDGINLTDYANRTLYAYWVETKNEAYIGQHIEITEDNGVQHTSRWSIGLDIASLKELGYTKIEVQLRIGIYAQDKGEGRDMWFDLYGNGRVHKQTQTLLSNANIQYGEEDLSKIDNYALIQFDIDDLGTSNSFDLGFKQTKDYFWTDAIWYFVYYYATFRAIDRAPHEAFPQDSVTLSTKSYTLEDNGGYNIYGRSYGYNPLGSKAFSSVSLDFVGGSLIEGNEVNGIRQYGYLMSDVYGTDDNVGLKLLLKYNYKTSDDNRINGTNYYISEDSYSGAINGVSGVGVVQSGALLVQKLKKGGNPNNAADWTWENPISKGTTESFHTTDFTDNYSPNDYDGNQRTIRTIGGVPIYNADGTVDYLMSGDNYVYQDCY